MAKEGLNWGYEYDAAQKEELTLYVTADDNQLSALHSSIQSLQKEIDELKKQVLTLIQT